MGTLLRLVLGLGLPLAVWSIAAAFLPHYLVPAPTAVAERFVTDWTRLAGDALVTSGETFGGLLGALAFSFTTAVLFRLFPRVERLGMPYAVAIKAVPIVALSPLLVIWFGNGIPGKIVLAGLVCFFPILIGTADGLRALPSDLSALSTVWCRNRVTRLRVLELPFAAPYLCSSLKVAGPLATVGAVVAEYSGANRGLGHIVLVAAYRVDTTLMFAGIIIIAAIGWTTYALAAALEREVLKRLRLRHVN